MGPTWYPGIAAADPLAVHGVGYQLRMGLLSIVPPPTGRWRKRCQIEYCRTVPPADRMSDFGDDPNAHDTAYERADFFKDGDRKGMLSSRKTIQGGGSMCKGFVARGSGRELSVPY